MGFQLMKFSDKNTEKIPDAWPTAQSRELTNLQAVG
jgi:hypothetical protein